MKIALVHDYMNQMGGAEKVLEQFCKIFPGAPVYTSIVDRTKLRGGFEGIDIRSSFIQKLPFLGKNYKKYLPLYPFAFENMRLSGYDCILSMSSGFAKGVSYAPNTLHINYCLTPMRFAWMYDQYNEKEKIPFYYKPLLLPLINNMRKWDLKKNIGVHRFITLSRAVQSRIKKWYGRDSDIIYPPVDTKAFIPGTKASDYFLIVSRLRGYKRIDLAVSACTALNLPLKIIGTGDCEKMLKQIAGPTIEFLGYCQDSDVVKYMQGCRAFLFPGEEDFGIAPLEAQACGKPVIAFGAGGALDTIVEGETGLFFKEQKWEALAAVLKQFNKCTFDPIICRKNALRFNEDEFRCSIKKYVESSITAFTKANNSSGF